jgi:acyl dehydratase
MLQAQHLKALVARKPGLAQGATIPRIERQVPPRSPSRAELTALRRSLHLPTDATTLPLTYPHVAAFLAHLGNMTDARFPLSPMGVVHVRNRIEQLRPIGAGEALGLTAYVEGHRDTEKGVEFDLMTEARAGDELVWHSASTMLSRRAAKGPKAAPKPLVLDDPEAVTEVWRLDAGMARRYAQVSGDLNPIHLSALTARLFGFKAPLMHGMWLIGRIGGQPADAPHPLVLQCDLKLPVLLPAQVLYRRWPRRGGGQELRVVGRQGDLPHLVGTLTTA